MAEANSSSNGLHGRIAAIAEAWIRLKSGWDTSHLQSLYQRVCQISEESGELSLFQLNEAAFSLEVYLSSFVDHPKPPSEEQLAEIEGLVRTLQAAAGEAPADVATAPAEPAQPDLPARSVRNFYTLLSTDSPAQPLLDAIRAGECQASEFHDPAQLLAAMQTELPGLVLTDTGQTDKLTRVSETIMRLRREQALDIPLVFVSENSLLSVRVAAMRAGASAYFVMPFDAEAIARQLTAMVCNTDEPAYRVTVVEDDASQAEFAAAILRRAGIEVDTVTEPLAVVDALQAFHPDLILMDIYMPEVNGLELTSIIRDFNEFVTTPIVFLSGERDADKQMDALSFGGDDFITKPVEADRLVSMVTHRIRRARKVREALAGGPHVRDQVTGLLSRNTFTSRAAEVLAGKHGGPTANALLLLRPDALIGLQAQIGIGGLDEIIAQAGERLGVLLEPHDQACRWEDHALGVLLRRNDDPALEAAAQQLQSGLTGLPHPQGLEPIAFSGGLYPLNDPAQSIDKAMRLAISACDNAVQAGGNRVARFSSPEPSSEKATPAAPDLGAVLRQALQSDSFSVYYQPLLDLQTRGSENFEILITLTAPDGEHFDWNRLEQTAASTGLQREIDRWILQRALDMLAERHASGRETQIFVRQSAGTASDPDHPGWLREQLRERQQLAGGLILDYALGDLSADLEAAQRNRQVLQELGVQLTISNFVAKPAAYKLLRYLCADYVRVSRKLLKAERTTISELISEAHRLDARVIVSNVDDPRAIDLHWSSGADYLQGDFIQRPLEDMDYDFSQVVM
jgi:PleD family two-component response regulator/EAL domain-containing protein (putative c-di-GMP-specific phosphodiesterase class I)